MMNNTNIINQNNNMNDKNINHKICNTIIENNNTYYYEIIIVMLVIHNNTNKKHMNNLNTYKF